MFLIVINKEISRLLSFGKPQLMLLANGAVNDYDKIKLNWILTRGIESQM